MYYFKHSNTANEGQTLTTLWAENDTELIAFFWFILESVSRFETEEKRGFWAGNLSYFKVKLGMKSQRSYRLLTKISERFQIDLEWISDQSFQLYVRNWLEFQPSWGGKRASRSVQDFPNIELRTKNLELKNIEKKKKEEDSKITNFAPDQLASPISLISRTFKESYLKAYGKEYPGWGAKENGQIRQWLRSISKDQALVLAAAYPFWNDPFVSKRGHPFGLLITNYVALSSHLEKPNAVFQKISNGKKFEMEQLEKAENDFKPKVTLQDLLKEAEEKEKNRKEISNDSR